MTNTIIRKLVIRPKEHIMFINVCSKTENYEFVEFQQLITFGKLTMRHECIWVHPYINSNEVSMFIHTDNYDKIIAV